MMDRLHAKKRWWALTPSMARSHKIRDSSIHEKPSFWTWKTLYKAWSLLTVFGSINKQTWMFYIYEIVNISLKEFTFMFKELTMTRFDLSYRYLIWMVIVAATAYASFGTWELNRQNNVLLIEWLPRTCTWHGPRVLLIQRMLKRHANFKWLK